jgi:hypothetical protein
MFVIGRLWRGGEMQRAQNGRRNAVEAGRGGRDREGDWVRGVGCAVAEREGVADIAWEE